MTFVKKLGALACMAVALTGCGRIGASTEARINAAVPLSDAAQSAWRAFDAEAKAQAVQVDVIAQAYQDRLKVRALECAHGYTPGLTASDGDIRAALTDQACFEAFDATLVQWLGVRQAGLLAPAPPLRPVPASPARVLVGERSIGEAVFAERAGVAALSGQRVVQLLDQGDGDVLAKIDLPVGMRGLSLSPNGRILLAGTGEGVSLLETASGRVMAQLPAMSAKSAFWVGRTGVLYVPRTGAQPVLLDLATGYESPVPFGETRLRAVARARGEGERYALVGDGRIGVIALTSTSLGLSAQLLQETRLVGSHSVSDGAVGVTADGDQFFAAAQDLRLMSADTLQVRSVDFEPLRLRTAMATGDPDVLLLAGRYREGIGNQEWLLYSIRARTLAPLLVDQLLSPRVIYVSALRRNAVIDGAKVQLLDALPTGPAVEADLYVREHAALAQREAEQRQLALQQQLARLANLSPSQQAAMPDAGAISAIMAAQARLPPSTRPAPDAALAAMARTARIEAVGVYEGTRGQAGSNDRAGTVQVRVAASSKPVILSLSAYEPVRWVITVEAGAKVLAVLQSGYKTGDVFGAGNARVYKSGSAYAYKRAGPQYMGLDAEVQAMTGKAIDTFQGAYTGTDFRVGGR